MKQLMEDWRKFLLTESVIDPKMVSLIDKAEKNNLKVLVGPYSATLVDGEFGVGSVSWEDGMHGPCLGSSYVTSANVKGGFGPLLYDVAIEMTGGVTPDRTEVSDEALRVWSYYEKNRDDVKKEQLDDLYDKLTPARKDNCEQESAIQDAGDDWHLSPLSKKYSKQGRPVWQELRKRGMLA